MSGHHLLFQVHRKPVPSDAGTVDTAGYSQAPGSPTMQVCFLCTTQTPDIRFTTHLQVVTMVDIASLIGKPPLLSCRGLSVHDLKKKFRFTTLSPTCTVVGIGFSGGKLLCKSCNCQSPCQRLTVGYGLYDPKPLAVPHELVSVDSPTPISIVDPRRRSGQWTRGTYCHHCCF